MTKAIVTCDAAAFQMNLISSVVQLIILFNPEFYPSIIFGGYLGSISGRSRRYTLLSSASLLAVEPSQRLQFTGHRIFFLLDCSVRGVNLTTNLRQLRYFCPAGVLTQVKVEFLSLPFIVTVFVLPAGAGSSNCHWKEFDNVYCLHHD